MVKSKLHYQPAGTCTTEPSAVTLPRQMVEISNPALKGVNEPVAAAREGGTDGGACLDGEAASADRRIHHGMPDPRVSEPLVPSPTVDGQYVIMSRRGIN